MAPASPLLTIIHAITSGYSGADSTVNDEQGREQPAVGCMSDHLLEGHGI